MDAVDVHDLSPRWLHDAAHRQPAGLRQFAQGETSVQITWANIGAATLAITLRDPAGRAVASCSIEHRGGPGAWSAEGLEPGTEYRVSVRAPGNEYSARASTAAARSSRPLARFATMSDLHLNRFHFGLRGTMEEVISSGGPFPARAVSAALAAAQARAVDAFVFKGDIVDYSSASGWRSAGELIAPAALGRRAMYLCGNHEVDEFAELDSFTEAAGYGIDLVRHVDRLRLDGVDIIGLNSAVPHLHSGALRPRAADAADLVADARHDGRQAAVFFHHQLSRTAVPMYFPPGIMRGESRWFVATLQAAGPVTLMSSGHTHRHRRKQFGSTVFSEVGSPKDYPGVWAEYEVSDAGIRQTVRRVEDPSVITWTEHTKWAVGGAWGRWSPGRLSDRCFFAPRPAT